MFNRKEDAVDKEMRTNSQLTELERKIEQQKTKIDSLNLQVEEKDRKIRTLEHQHAMAIEQQVNENGYALRAQDLEHQEELAEINITHDNEINDLKSKLKISETQGEVLRAKAIVDLRAEYEKRVKYIELEHAEANAKLIEKDKFIDHLIEQLKLAHEMVDHAYAAQSAIAISAVEQDHSPNIYCGDAEVEE